MHAIQPCNTDLYCIVVTLWHHCLLHRKLAIKLGTLSSVSASLFSIPLMIVRVLGDVRCLICLHKGGGIRFCPCLSVCLLARLLKNACLDLDETLCVDRCRDMDKLLTFEPDPDYSPDTGIGLLSPISFKRCYTEFYTGKIRHIRINLCSEAWFYSLSHRNTFVEGTCAPPSALLVFI